MLISVLVSSSLNQFVSLGHAQATGCKSFPIWIGNGRSRRRLCFINIKYNIRGSEGVEFMRKAALAGTKKRLSLCLLPFYLSIDEALESSPPNSTYSHNLGSILGHLHSKLGAPPVWLQSLLPPKVQLRNGSTLAHGKKKTQKNKRDQQPLKQFLRDLRTYPSHENPLLLFTV